MKTHEETWTWDSVRGLIMCGERRVSLMAFDGDGRLAAAAPEMARALLEIGDAIRAGMLDTDEGAPELIRRVLTKAGVPLP